MDPTQARLVEVCSALVTMRPHQPSELPATQHLANHPPALEVGWAHCLYSLFNLHLWCIYIKQQPNIYGVCILYYLYTKDNNLFFISEGIIKTNLVRVRFIDVQRWVKRGVDPSQFFKPLCLPPQNLKKSLDYPSQPIENFHFKIKSLDVPGLIILYLLFVNFKLI